MAGAGPRTRTGQPTPAPLRSPCHARTPGGRSLGRGGRQRRVAGIGRERVAHVRELGGRGGRRVRGRRRRRGGGVGRGGLGLLGRRRSGRRGVAFERRRAQRFHDVVVAVDRRAVGDGVPRVAVALGGADQLV